MRITKSDQYNQSVGRSKLFSSVAGVGAILISKFGTSSLVLCIEEWGIIQKVNQIIKEVDTDPAIDQDNKYPHLKKRLLSNKIKVIDDPRFLDFIKIEQELPNLLTLVDVPHITLNERNNYIQTEDGNYKNDPILDFYIPSVHFPTYFVGRKSKNFRTLDWWKRKWRTKNRFLDLFAPPKDYASCGDKIVTKENVFKFNTLIQNNLVFICRYGHLSNLPWSKYLYWKNQKLNIISRSDGYDDKGKNLLHIQDCCNDPKLTWTENRNTSEGYSNIWLECENGNCLTQKINLEGINGIQPSCSGSKPWEGSSELDNSFEPRDNYCNCSETRIAMISASSIYYSRSFTNIYLPVELAIGISEDVKICVGNQERKYLKLKDKRGWDRNTFADKMITEDNLFDNYEDQINNDAEFVSKVKDTFINKVASQSATTNKKELYENFRYQEFKSFTSNSKYNDDNRLSFNQIIIPEKISPFFDVIARVNIMAESQIQLGFSRIAPLDSDDNSNQMSIYKSQKVDVRCLPSIQSIGEGIFFSINQKSYDNWIKDHKQIFRRIEILTQGENNMNAGLRQKLEKFGLKFLMTHSLSHMLMRGLEFTCGYPTSSLKERLYISERMNGFLIYTSEGSEGSMGGLVSQSKEENLLRLFNKSFQEAYECSSDPLCWESDSQGVSGLNLAACFSCSLVSETSCEEFNLGLDRRVVIDPEFGFFKEFQFE